MLSKKLTVSFLSLFTILALAFVAPTAMAEKVEVTITGPTTVKHPPTVNQQVEVVLQIEFSEAVDLPLSGFNEINTATVDDTLVGRLFTSDSRLIDHNIGQSALDFTFALADNFRGTTSTLTKLYAMVSVLPSAYLNAQDDLPFKMIVTVPSLSPADPTSKTMASEVTHHTFTITKPESTARLPRVVSIQRLRPGSQSVVAAFQEERLDLAHFPSFDVRIVLTEAPRKPGTNDIITAIGDLVEVENGTASTLIKGVPFARQGIGAYANTPSHAQRARTTLPHPIEGMYQWDSDNATTSVLFAGLPNGLSADWYDTVPPTSGPDNMYHQYRLTITPHQKSGDFDVKIKVKNFHDGGSPRRDTYLSPDFGASMNLPNGRQILTVPVKGAPRDMKAGYRVTIAKDWIIPAGGYLIIAQNKDGSEIVIPDDRTNDTPRATHRTPVELLYNVYETADLPNLATQFLNGVVVDVESQHAGLVISEVMWGEDVSLDLSTQSQWIELYNPGAQYKTVDDADHTPDVNEALTLIFYAPNEFDAVPAKNADGSLPAGVTDRIGTLEDATGAYWSPAGKGQSGRSGTTAIGTAAERGEFVDVVPIVSMYRMMEMDGAIDAMMGQMAASWMSSAGPKSANFEPLAIGLRHGTPGAPTDATVTPADLEAEKEKAARESEMAMVAGASDIVISEIMVDTGNSRLPQWIELTNVSKKEVSLAGWSLMITNADADADVIGHSVSINLSGMLGIGNGAGNGDMMGKSLLLVGGMARSSGNLAGSERVMDVSAQVGGQGRYKLISDMAFMIALLPPQKTGVLMPGDTAGNLEAAHAWDLPMSETGRSSLIRMDLYNMPMMGTDANAWVLASNTRLVSGPATWYGSDEDDGTPGYAAGGPLPVELSHFRPARDKATGAVVITWATQSELNNAGFFIKRAQQRNGEFKVINATMVPGAGTTSEKQFYTYTDTTAQPNIVYYYQIEDVSLDGQRQVLTHGIRLKGHIGAAGKLTATWGELKSVNE